MQSFRINHIAAIRTGWKLLFWNLHVKCRHHSFSGITACMFCLFRVRAVRRGTRTDGYRIYQVVWMYVHCVCIQRGEMGRVWGDDELHFASFCLKPSNRSVIFQEDFSGILVEGFSCMFLPLALWMPAAISENINLRLSAVTSINVKGLDLCYVVGCGFCNLTNIRSLNKGGRGRVDWLCLRRDIWENKKMFRSQK